MDVTRINAGAAFKKSALTTDSEGIPKLTLTFEVYGTAGIEQIDIADLSTLIGKPVGLAITGVQLQLMPQRGQAGNG